MVFTGVSLDSGTGSDLICVESFPSVYSEINYLIDSAVNFSDSNLYFSTSPAALTIIMAGTTAVFTPI